MDFMIYFLYILFLSSPATSCEPIAAHSSFNIKNSIEKCFDSPREKKSEFTGFPFPAARFSAALMDPLRQSVKLASFYYPSRHRANWAPHSTGAKKLTVYII